MNQHNIDIVFEFIKWQYDIFSKIIENKYRFFVISAGRQSGKTFFCCFVIIYKVLLKSDSIAWWVAPVFQQSKIAFRRVTKLLNKFKIQHKINKSDLCITFSNKSTIWFKSADNEDSLRGETVDFLVNDETGYTKRDAWEYVLRGTITVSRAQCIFIGTPKGKNLFFELFCKGADKEEKEWFSLQISSNESPYFLNDEWESVQKLPRRIFEQEYLAQFLDDGGEVFRNIRSCVKGNLENYHAKKFYYMGIDLAKSFDYTVICILDNNGHLVYFDRFNEISWNIQKSRIIRAYNIYKPVALLDSTGLGDPILDDLQIAGINIEGYDLTNTSKRQLIERLAIGLEFEKLSFPEIPELINELNIFTFEQLPSGKIRYEAPEGMHDDIVIALAFAFWLYSGSIGITEKSYEFDENRDTNLMDF